MRFSLVLTGTMTLSLAYAMPAYGQLAEDTAASSESATPSQNPEAADPAPVSNPAANSPSPEQSPSVPPKSEVVAKQTDGTNSPTATPSVAPPHPEAVPGEDADHPADGGLVNLQHPVHLQWHVLGELGLPGVGGFRVGANFYVPQLPIMIGGQFFQYWGVSPSHLARERSSFLTRQLGSSRNLEVRAGFVISDWSMAEQDGHYDYDFQATGNPNVTQFTRATYSSELPTRTQVAIYGGYRARSPLSGSACPTDKSLPEDCAENKQGFIMLGVDWMTAFDVNYKTREHGWLHSSRQRNFDFHLLYTPTRNDYARDTLLKRVGAEVSWTHRKDWLAFSYGFGWDGVNALLSLGIGAGSNHSFAGASPSVSHVR